MSAKGLKCSAKGCKFYECLYAYVEKIILRMNVFFPQIDGKISTAKKSKRSRKMTRTSLSKGNEPFIDYSITKPCFGVSLHSKTDPKGQSARVCSSTFLWLSVHFVEQVSSSNISGLDFSPKASSLIVDASYLHLICLISSMRLAKNVLAITMSLSKK